MDRRLRNICITWNNYPPDAIEQLKAIPHRYCVFGIEGRTTKNGKKPTPHIQGYIELQGQKRFSWFKKHFPKIHIEARKGTAEEAAKYCKKEGEFKEFGSISSQGYRSDLASLYAMTKDGLTDTQIGEEAPKNYIKFYKAVDRVRFNYAREDRKWEPVEVFVFYGDAGTGKTRKVYELEHNDVYRVICGNSTIWFDGYQGQEAILIDDFYGSNIKWTYFLQLLDGYKFQLPIKGGFTWKQWKRVYITSNRSPEEWYPNKGFPRELERRLTHIQHFEEEVPVVVLPGTCETSEPILNE